MPERLTGNIVPNFGGADCNPHEVNTEDMRREVLPITTVEEDKYASRILTKKASRGSL